MTTKETPKIVCFGEVLWDLLPSGKIAGGAPMNVAYHANQLGAHAQVISKVGQDTLGVNLVDFLNGKRVDTKLIQTDDEFPTGSVNVLLDANGSPSYEIVEPAAWDHIQADDINSSEVKKADAFVYGSLSTRHSTSRNTLLQLLSLAKLKVLDVNLRIPFYSKDLLMLLLEQADIVKMNDEELAIVGQWLSTTDTEINTAQQIKNHFNLQQLIVTRGADGAWLFADNEMITNQGVTIKVQDTIGSGDAFLAAYLCKYLAEEPLEDCLQFAALTGAYVATQKGGTPELSESQIRALIT